MEQCKDEYKPLEQKRMSPKTSEEVKAKMKDMKNILKKRVSTKNSINSSNKKSINEFTLSNSHSNIRQK